MWEYCLCDRRKLGCILPEMEVAITTTVFSLDGASLRLVDEGLPVAMMWAKRIYL